ncbi:MAG TPA: enoyl-CoA hydratase [Stellaceae bacterium]|nr:enoyl-CoA hydratase [Stellaceae bacterium]
MSASEAVLLRQDRDGIARLTLNRPAQRNALSVELMGALQEALDAIARDRKVKLVVISANGPGFCAGHDLREMRANPGRQHYEALFARCSRLMVSLTKLPQPVIARVHGIAAAAGCQLVASCDLAVASSAARFAVNGINIGLFCSTPMVALTRAVGRKPAMEMLLTGDLVEAEQAKAIGLVNRVVPPERLDEEVDALARQIAGKLTLAVAMGKEAFYRQAELGLEAAYAFTSDVMTKNMLARDTEEGVDAFLEKRQPRWNNE